MSSATVSKEFVKNLWRNRIRLSSKLFPSFGLPKPSPSECRALGGIFFGESSIRGLEGRQISDCVARVKVLALDPDESLVKVLSIADQLRFPQKIREKDSADGQSRRDSQQDKKDQNAKDESGKKPVTFEDVERAVTEFDGDAQVQGHGLIATAVGQGPGLRVVLKDGSGAVVRQFTGDEFLKLREAAVEGTPNRGRLLDRKL